MGPTQKAGIFLQPFVSWYSTANIKVYYRTVFNSYSAGKPLGVAESKQMKNTP